MSSFFKQRKDLAIIIASMVLIILFRYGRVAEDAFFTLRMVFQFLHGHGLVWNVGERVMVSTSPLYLLLSCVLIAITQEYYWSTILLSAIISVSFLLGWWRLCQRKPLYYFLSLLTLTSTIAFRDFMISGFETPLSISLITWLIVAYRSRVSIFPYSLLCSLLALTRFDFVLLIIPMAVLYVWRERSKFCMRAAFHGLCGTIPLWSWLVFSFLYYGTIYPNTYYAKTFALFPPYEQLKKGFIFTIYHLNADPALIFLLISSIIICFKRKFLGAILAAASYIWYVCSIGGDYMIGRMFTPVAVFLLGFIVIARPSLLKYIAPCMLGLSVISVVLPIQTAISYNCIEDERRYRSHSIEDKCVVFMRKRPTHRLIAK